MFDCFSLTSALIVMATGLLLQYWYKRPNNFPPGPRGFPLIGVIPYLGDRGEEVFAKWVEKYGTVFSVRMGREDWVLLNSYEDIKQVGNVWLTACHCHLTNRVIILDGHVMEI